MRHRLKHHQPAWGVVARLVWGAVALGLSVSAAGPVRAESVQTNGSATVSDGVLRLTLARTYQRGSAWSTQKVPVAGGFVTTFGFRITDRGGVTDSTGKVGGDGFAFVIQNSSPAALGNNGNGIGYDGIPNSLAIEFDTYLTGSNSFYVPDRSDNEVSIHCRGIYPNSSDEVASLAGITPPINLSDGQEHTVNVIYVPGTLAVTLDGLPTAILNLNADLTRLLRLDAGRAYVGFTAATGAAYETHGITTWDFWSF